MRILNTRCLLIAGLLLAGLGQSVQAQGFGNRPTSAYRQSRFDQSVNRGFGNAGRSPGSGLNSNIGSRLPGPRLGNTPQANRTPVLNPSLNLVPGVSSSFGGQFLLRTQPFENIGAATNRYDNELSTIQRNVASLAEQGGTKPGQQPPMALIRSGLTPTGHNVGFLNTGSFYPR